LGRLGDFFLVKLKKQEKPSFLEVALQLHKDDLASDQGPGTQLTSYTGQQFCCITLANQSIADGAVDQVKQWMRWNWKNSCV